MWVFFVFFFFFFFCCCCFFFCFFFVDARSLHIFDYMACGTKSNSVVDIGYGVKNVNVLNKIQVTQEKLYLASKTTFNSTIKWVS